MHQARSGPPWKIMARYHRVELKNGYILEIGWSQAMSAYGVKYFKAVPTVEEEWGTDRRIFGHTVKEVLSIARREFAEIANPDIAKVRQRVTGEDGGVLTADKMRQAFKAMTLGTNYGAQNRRLYVSKETAALIKEMHIDSNIKSGLQGLSPIVAIVDELADSDSIFAIKDDSLTALKYLMDSSDKKPRR